MANLPWLTPDQNAARDIAEFHASMNDLRGGIFVPKEHWEQLVVLMRSIAGDSVAAKEAVANVISTISANLGHQ
jgi:hypothetical protein